MAILSTVDLLFVIIASLPVVAVSIYKSWKWQHGSLGALDQQTGIHLNLLNVGFN